MSRYEIVPCSLGHLRMLARTMRAEDRAEIEALGLKPRHVLFHQWRASIEPKAGLVDGEVAACWGDAAPLLAAEGSIWLFTAPPIERVPLAYFQEARRDIAERLRVRRVLRAHVACDYERALRFFAMLGFRVGDVVTMAGGAYREIRIERE
jgi:hypothetical protein